MTETIVPVRRRGTPPTTPKENKIMTMTAVRAAAKSKRLALTPSEYKARKAAAEAASGYDSSSPIWNKQLPEVLELIKAAIMNGEDGEALDYIHELRKRDAKRRLTYER